MMPTVINEQAPIPPPSYHRREVQAQAQRARALHINALTFIETLHLLALCRLAVQVAHRRCPPPLPKGAGGRPRTYREESLLLIALLKTLWRLSYQEVHDWLESWPALALAFGLPLDPGGKPCIPSPSQLCKRSSIERFFGRVFLFFRLQRPAYSGWSTIVRQVALTYTASLVVGLAAWQAHRPDLIRSPKRILAHLWEDSQL